MPARRVAEYNHQRCGNIAALIAKTIDWKKTPYFSVTWDSLGCSVGRRYLTKLPFTSDRMTHVYDARTRMRVL